jgi:signal transduction histidine kinase
MAFVDECTLFVTSGKGGDGSASMHSEPYKARGGPDGGNGGDGGSVILEVEDNRDIPVSEDPSASFDPLAKRERLAGTGLGLAISKRIAEEVAGRIEAESRSPNRTLFRLVVPLSGAS